MKMMEAGVLAQRFAHFSDERLAASVAEVENLPLSPFERGILDDVRAEIERRKALSASGSTTADDGSGST